MSYLIVRNANLVHSESKVSLEFMFNATLIVCKKSGKILRIFKQNEEPQDIDSYFPENEQIVLKEHQILVPGFVDTHAHAPQYSFAGTGLDLPLLDWLKKYTFKYEARFSDLKYAEQVYRKSVNSHLQNGTTTICFYGTIHLEATKVLSDILDQIGMRGFVGKVCMDQNAPDYYIEESSAKSCDDTLSFIKYLKDKNSSVTPVVTPRFGPTCSRELLKGLGAIAEKHKIPIQTHLSENKEEIEWVKSLFPECKSYTDVYAKYGILKNGTVLAPCIYLTPFELELIKEKGAGISHCPNSNTTLQSGIMPARNYMQKGLKMGLGTDVAGGFTTSILDAIRACVGVSKLYSCLISKSSKPLSLAEAFYLATVGGAELLGIGDKIGSFKPNMEFDAQLWDYSKLDYCLEKENDHFIEIFEKIVYLADSRHIKKVFVKGKEIFNQE